MDVDVPENVYCVALVTLLNAAVRMKLMTDPPLGLIEYVVRFPTV